MAGPDRQGAAAGTVPNRGHFRRRPDHARNVRPGEGPPDYERDVLAEEQRENVGTWRGQRPGSRPGDTRSTSPHRGPYDSQYRCRRFVRAGAGIDRVFAPVLAARLCARNQRLVVCDDAMRNHKAQIPKAKSQQSESWDLGFGAWDLGFSTL